MGYYGRMMGLWAFFVAAGLHCHNLLLVQAATISSSSSMAHPLHMAVLTPHDIWTSQRGGSTYRRALQTNLEGAVAEAVTGVNVTYTWRDVGRKQCSSVAQTLFRQHQDLEVVLAPSFQAPFRTTFYTRREAGGANSSGAIRMASTALTIPPYSKAFDAAVGLCHHFEWRNVVLMNADDHFMGLAQLFRQRLTDELVTIRSHAIISSALAEENTAEVEAPSKVQVGRLVGWVSL